jgi:hypothetical protein
MKTHWGRTVMIVLLALAATGSARGATNNVTADVVSVNAVNRTLVVRISGGSTQTVELDDAVAGIGDLKAGDRAILTLRNEPGRMRVTRIIRAAAPQAQAGAKPTAETGPNDHGDAAAAARALSERTAVLAGEASRVDGLWSSFREACDVKVDGQYEGGREWFSLWDNRAKADLSSGFCRDLFDQVVSAGSNVNKSMAAAEGAARKTMLPGSIRDVTRRYAMDWDGWGRPAPVELEK